MHDQMTFETSLVALNIDWGLLGVEIGVSSWAAAIKETHLLLSGNDKYKFKVV